MREFEGFPEGMRALGLAVHAKVDDLACLAGELVHFGRDESPGPPRVVFVFRLVFEWSLEGLFGAKGPILAPFWSHFGDILVPFWRFGGLVISLTPLEREARNQGSGGSAGTTFSVLFLDPYSRCIF